MEERAERTPPPVELHLATGPLRLAALKPTSPWALIIDGDLEVSGDIDLSTEPYETSLFVVLGHVRARNLRFDGSAACFVSKSLVLSGGCFGSHGDEGAALYAESLTARTLMLDGHTGANVATLEGVAFGSEDWGLPQHFTSADRAADFFIAEALNAEGDLDQGRAWTLMTSGRDPFLPGAYELLRARKVEAPGREKPR